MENIENGYTIWARKTIESDVFFYKPDKWFKIWFYIVNKVNHKDNKNFKRGSGLITYEEIMFATKASKTQVQKCIKYLEKENMLGYERTTRGMIRSVNKYNIYQDPKKYKTTSETTSETSERQLRDNLETLPINKNDNNEKNDNKYKKLFLSGKEYNVRTKQLKDGCLACMLNGVWVDYYNPTVVMDLSKYKELI